MGTSEDSLSDAAIRLDKLDAQTAAVKLSLLRMSVYVAVRRDEMRQHVIDGCLAADVLSAPPKTFADDVRRVIGEVLSDRE